MDGLGNAPGQQPAGGVGDDHRQQPGSGHSYGQVVDQAQVLLNVEIADGTHRLGAVIDGAGKGDGGLAVKLDEGIGFLSRQGGNQVPGGFRTPGEAGIPQELPLEVKNLNPGFDGVGKVFAQIGRHPHQQLPLAGGLLL